MRFKGLILYKGIFNGNVATSIQIQVPSRLENRDGNHLRSGIFIAGDIEL